ncbi:MFS transporter [Allohahella marinimesophila]|uniref:Major facilitator superfamily domain-containing protein 6 n=1 Tax=Allohahella marinimesophila TaxID=1054972 RepID=A0ABP7NWY8_9GAMM
MGASFRPISAAYFWYFALVGTIAPFLPDYFRLLGLNHAEIGYLVASVMVTKILAPNIWAIIADATGQRLRLIHVGISFALVALLIFPLLDSFWPLLLLMVFFSAFWNAVLPQFEVITLAALREQNRQHHYSRIRLWGSVGFIAVVIGLGAVFEYFGLALLPYAMIILMASLLWSSLMIRAPESPGRMRFAEVLSIFTSQFKSISIVLFFIVAFLVQLSFGPYYTFFTIHLKNIGYSFDIIGILWAVGVLAEVGLFLIMHRFLRRFSLRLLMLAALALTTLRWWGIAELADHVWLLLLFQLGHALSFGCVHAVSIEFIHRAFGRGSVAGQGQALYSAVSFGAGGAVGAWASGQIAFHYSAGHTFHFATASAAAAMFVLLLGWRACGPETHWCVADKRASA